jgi:hypothetical protein
VQIFTASDLYVAPDMRQTFEALRREMLLDIQPVNSVQAELFNTALRSAWMLRRCDASERQLAQDLGVDPLLSQDRRIDRLRITRAQEQREYRTAINQLRRLQTDHMVRQLENNEGLQALPVTIDTKAYIQAARQATGAKRDEPLYFAPFQAATDAKMRQRGLGANAWDAWLKRQPGAQPKTDAA